MSGLGLEKDLENPFQNKTYLQYFWILLVLKRLEIYDGNEGLYNKIWALIASRRL